MSLESTRNTVQRYLNAQHGDVSMLAEDVVFTTMATGQETMGREAVLGMMNYLYHVAFDATAVPWVTLFGETNAVLEGSFVGRHIGEFNGIPATGKDVNVPMCIVYYLENDLIKNAHIYFEIPVLLQQLGVAAG